MKLTKNQQMLLGAAALVAVGVYLYRRNKNGNGNGNTSSFSNASGTVYCDDNSTLQYTQADIDSGDYSNPQGEFEPGIFAEKNCPKETAAKATLGGGRIGQIGIGGLNKKVQRRR